MLVEVAASGLEPTHITTPLRTSLKRTRALCLGSLLGIVQIRFTSY
jgi:hypothetical protein